MTAPHTKSTQATVVKAVVLLAIFLVIAGYGDVLEALKRFRSLDEYHGKARFLRDATQHSFWSKGASNTMSQFINNVSQHYRVQVPLVSNVSTASRHGWSKHHADSFDEILFVHSKGSLTTAMSRKLQASVPLQTVCAFMNGSFDESGKCVICREDNCFIMGDDIVARSDNFCTTTAFPSSDETKYCGTAKCYQDGWNIRCVASIPFLDHTLNGSATCTLDLSCTCNGVTWDGEPCSTCEGAADGYDCQNLLGPVKIYVKPLDPVRSYRNNLFFWMAVNTRTMHQVSIAAGIPIGGAVGNQSWPARKQFIPGDYTSLTPSNWMKWPYLLQDRSVLGVYDFTLADEVADFAVSSGIQLRGHCLLWTVREGDHYPTAVRTQVDASDDPVTILKDIMRDHIHTVAQHFRDKVGVWDVVNEHLFARTDVNIFYTTLGDDYVKLAFELTREVLPNTPLVWNEALTDFSLSNPSTRIWLELLQKYRNEGVPVDRVGVQGHTIGALHNITALRVFLRTVAEMGYDVEVTEFDAPLGKFSAKGKFLPDPYQAQADYFAEYLRACLDSGRCKGFTNWGLSDDYSWLDSRLVPSAPNRPLMMDDEGYPKPAWLSLRNELDSYANTATIFNWFLGILSSLWSKIVILTSLGWSLITR